MTTVETCSVCGRSILKGERTRTYVTPEADRRPVCELCHSRAESLGWVWEEALADRPPTPAEPRRRRRVLSGLLRGWLEADREGAPAGQAEAAGPDAGDRRKTDGSARGSAERDPAARGARVGRAGPSERHGTRLERAVDRFNRSEHARTVAGLTRTLGAPSVSVGMAAGSPGEVRITVAWELSWYQWGVDVGDEERPVYEVDKGHEMEDLAAPARQWNAHVSEQGEVRIGPAPAAAAEGEPAGAES